MFLVKGLFQQVMYSTIICEILRIHEIAYLVVESGTSTNVVVGTQYNQSLKNVTLSNSLQTWTLNFFSNQRRKSVALPNSLQNLTFSDTCIFFGGGEITYIVHHISTYPHIFIYIPIHLFILLVRRFRKAVRNLSKRGWWFLGCRI